MQKIFVLFLLCVTLFAGNQPIERVSLQLMWLDQFQFAGYYIAKEKGFYKDVGLDVQIKKYQYSMSVTQEVLNQRSEYGIGRSSLIQAFGEKQKLVGIAAIFQTSPMVIIALESSHIDSVEDFVGKKLMLTKDAVETASIHAMISSAHVDEKKLIFKGHNFKLKELIDGDVDLYAVDINADLDSDLN